MSDHAKISPSAYARWMNCPGSVHVQSESKPSAAALEGIAAHKEFEKALRTKYRTKFTYNIGECVEYVRGLEGTKLTETRSNVYEALGFEDPIVWGTADVVVIREDELEILDLKYGRSHVKADSPQLELYAFGFAHWLDWDFDKVRTTILQPRSKGNTIRSRTLTKDELFSKIERYRVKIETALNPDAPRIPGNKQCWFCSYKGQCPEYQEHFITSQFEDLS